MSTYHSRSTYQSRGAHRRAVQQWLAQIDFELFVTLAFPHNVGIGRARQTLRHWFACVDSYYLGKNWNRRPWDERTSAIAFPENIISNLHYHCLLRLPESAQGQTPLQQCRILARYWTKAVPRGTCEGRSIGDRRRAVRYATKQLVKPGYEDKFILASEFHLDRN